MKYISDHIKSLISLIVVIAAFSYFFFTYFIGKAQADPQIIIAIVGALTTVINYHLGSSNSSSKKDALISTMATNPATQNVDEINTEAINVKK